MCPRPSWVIYRDYKRGAERQGAPGSAGLGRADTSARAGPEQQVLSVWALFCTQEDLGV